MSRLSTLVPVWSGRELELEQVQDFLDGKIAAASKAVVKIGADAVYSS